MSSAQTVTTNYDTEMLVKVRQQQKVDGQNAVRLIETAAVRSPEVERLRHPDSTISVLA